MIDASTQLLRHSHDVSAQDRNVKRQSIAAIVAMGILMTPKVANANMIWPAAVLASRLISWPTIVFGLCLEFLVLIFAIRLSVTKALLSTVAMNFASTLLGVFLIPLLGLVWEIGPGQVAHRMLSVGTFNPITYVGTFVIAVAVNTAIEGAVLSRLNMGLSRKSSLLWLIAANTVTVGIVAYSFVVLPPSL